MLKVLKSAGLLVLALSFVLSAFSSTSVYAKSKQHKNVKRATEAYQALQKYFYQSEYKLYHENYPYTGGNQFSYAWPYSQAFAATNAMLGLPHIGDQYLSDASKRLQGLKAYWDGDSTPAGYDSYVLPPLGQGGDKFYDDNAVIGLALVHYYKLTQNLWQKGNAGEEKAEIEQLSKTALEQAKKAFAFDVSGWDDNASHPYPGGLFWVQASWTRIRATNATSIAAELGLRLYQITGDEYYFDWAKKMYDWVNASMLAPNGLYWNSVDLNGNINKAFWSYSQGAMIGTSVLFYKITNDPSYLKRAENIANAALSFWDTDIPLYEQPPIFNARFFGNLLMLQLVDHNPKYRQAVQDYADYVWDHNRDPETGLFFGANYQGLLKQSAMVKIYGALAAQSPKRAHQENSNR